MPSEKFSKKRSATSQPGPSRKKIQLENFSAQKKRSQPVTKPLQPDSDSESDSDLVDEDAWIDDEAIKDDVGEIEEDAEMQERDQSQKDPNASREGHKAQKVVQDQRRAAKPHSNILVDAKRLWALARQKNMTSAERQKHIQQLMDLLRGKVKEVVLKHDASRIVQTLVKHGKQKERDEIAVELKGNFRQLAQSRYSKFLVSKLIRLCPSQRVSILQEFQGHVLRMLLHKEASTVLSDAFESYCNTYERSLLLRDFYGKEVALFSVTAGTHADKEKSRLGLSGVLNGVDPERRKRVLSSMQETLTTIFNNPDKGAIGHALVHRALWEYLSAVNDSPNEDEREKLRRAIFDLCQPDFPEIVHTRDGSRVVREFLARGTAKDRKQILKIFKPHIENMCKDEDAQLVLFTAIDVIDDTKLTLKSLVTEMTSAISTLSLTIQGRRSLLYLIAPRSRRHFTPAQISTLVETDALRALTSKKDPALREKEIREGASEALIQWVQEKGGEAIREPAGSLMVTEIMLYAEGDKTLAIETLLVSISAPYPSNDTANPHSMDLPHTSRVYKTLLQGGHFNHVTKAVERVPSSSWNTASFALRFVEDLDESVVVAMCTQGERNGAFVVAELCAALVDGKDENGRNRLKRWLGESVVKSIEDGDGKGKKILMEKIKCL